MEERKKKERKDQLTVFSASSLKKLVTYQSSVAPGSSTRWPRTVTLSSPSCQPEDAPSAWTCTWQLTVDVPPGTWASKPLRRKAGSANAPDRTTAGDADGHPLPEYDTDEIEGRLAGALRLLSDDDEWYGDGGGSGVAEVRSGRAGARKGKRRDECILYGMSCGVVIS